MRNIAIYVAIALISLSSASAQESSDGRKLAELTFAMVDTAGKGHVNQGDMEQLRGQIFTSMDADDDKRIELQEFLAWDYGFANIAAEANNNTAYLAALKVVFSLWDRDSDGSITETEHRKSMIADFNRSDLNGDAILDEKEFLSGLSVLVAIRSVIEPG